MKGRILTEEIITQFKIHLQNEEKSENTIEKYIRDVRAFADYMNDSEITKEAVINTHYASIVCITKSKKVFPIIAPWFESILKGGDNSAKNET